MIKSLQFSNYVGESKILTIELGAPETSGLWVKSIKGIGPGKATINTTDMASSDGGIFNSARSEIRNITITLGLMEYSDDNGNYSVETVRRRLYKYFGKKNQLRIYINTDYAGGFTLYTDGYVESCEPNIFSKDETIDISIICPNPNFYNIDGYDGIDFSGTEAVFEFPMDYTESLDDPFIVGQFYYEYDSETDTYFLTVDQVRQSGKTYYTGGLSNELYAITADTERQSGKIYYTYDPETGVYSVSADDPFDPETTYYEIREYTQTTDTEFIKGKEYFEEDPENQGQYMMTPDLEMNSEKTYYEYTNQIIFADIQQIIEQAIDYYGEIEVGVTITLHFNDIVRGVKIFKLLGDYDEEEMSIDDTALAAMPSVSSIAPGDIIEICTVKGQKYATLSRGTESYNIMNALGRNPNWFQLDYGENIFSYSAESGQEFIDCSINYNEAYEGV